MDREQELEVTKTAFFLEDRLSSLNNERNSLYRAQPLPPKKPQEKFLQAEPIPYPKIEVTQQNMGRWWLRGFVIFWLLFPLGLYILKKDYTDAYNRCVDQVKNSKEYQNKCKEIDQQNQARQMQLDQQTHAQYLQACKQYNDLVAKYNQDFPQWQVALKCLNDTINDTQQTLQQLYQISNIIPMQYRTRSALLYLSAFLGTSNYDLKYAIERYDTYILQAQQREHIDISRAQLQLAKEAMQNQQYATWLQEQQIELSQNGNALLKNISSWQKADTGMRTYWRWKNSRRR